MQKGYRTKDLIAHTNHIGELSKVILGCFFVLVSSGYHSGSAPQALGKDRRLDSSCCAATLAKPIPFFSTLDRDSLMADSR